MHQNGRQYEKKRVMPVVGFKPTAYIANNYNNFFQGGAIPAELFVLWLAMECS